MKNIFSNPRLRRGALASAFTAMVLVIIVLLNMVAGRLSQKYNLSADLTTGQVFTISEETGEYLAGLDKDVQIYILNTEQNFTYHEDPSLSYALQQAGEIIKKYARLSDRIQVTYVDIMRDPGFVNKYSGLQPTMNNILVECGDNVRLLLADDLFNWMTEEENEYSYYYMTSSKAEQVMTGAIVAVTTDVEVTAAVLNGHAEAQTSGLTSRLLLNNYRVQTLNTLAQEISSDITLLIIAAPLVDYESFEIEALEQFLYNDGQYGKTIFYLAAIDQPELPMLDAFLARWGIRVKSGVVFETNPNMQSDNSRYFTNVLYAEEKYSRVAARSGLPVSMPNARPLESVDAQGVTTTPLLVFSQDAGIRAADTLGDRNWTSSLEDIAGPFPALLLSEKSEGGNPSYVLAVATSLAVEESNMSRFNLSNSRYFLSLLGSLTFREDNIVIENKELGAAMLNISHGQSMVWGFVFFVLLPLAVLVAGGVMFIRRRHM